MTEQQIRKKLVDTAISYLGYKESDGSHKRIIDIYNRHSPLAQGYIVRYADEWCDTFASAVAITCGFTDIIPTECGCQRHIELFKKIGCWQEDDSYVPNSGDYIFYDWSDTGVGDNTGHADHVGIVVSVTGSTMKIIEGNLSNAVGYRNLKVNARYIRGYGVPRYADKVTESSEDNIASATQDSSFPWKIGDIVTFIGTEHYISTHSTSGKTCKPGKARITSIACDGYHLVHLIAVAGGGSTVYGWVDAALIAQESADLAVGKKVKVVTGARTYTGGKLASFVYNNVFDVIEIRGDRVVIGIGEAVTAAVNRRDIIVVQ